jgi:hypothetical protein
LDDANYFTHTLLSEKTEVLYDPDEIVKRVVEQCNAIKYIHNLGISLSIIHSVYMNRIHIISGTVIATISLLLVTTSMSDQQSAFAHKGYYNYGHYHNNHYNGGSAAAAAAAGDSAAAAAAAGDSAAAAAAAGGSAAAAAAAGSDD